jgi:hypothetical protein
MSLRNAFGNLALDATVQSVYTWLQARLGAKTTANSISVNIANDQTVPISAVNLPLPSGASTAANQTTANTSLNSIDGKLPALSSGRVPVDVGSSINVGEVEIKNDTGNPVPVSAASLPLPTGAATAANQSTANSSLASLDAKAPALVSGRVPVDGSNVTQPISASSLPLPTDAATATLQSAGNSSLVSLDSKLPALDGDSTPITDNGLLAAVRESFDNANSTLNGMVLQDDAIPDPSKPAGPALQVTMRDPIQLDPSVAAVTGGIDPTGTVQRTRVGVDGGTQLTDCKQFVGTTQVVNGTPTGWIDTTGYQSIVVTFFGSMTALLAFQTTNDTTYLQTNASGWNVSGQNVPTSSATNPTNGTTYIFPVTAKFFRIIVVSYTSGIVGAVVTLRCAPFTPACFSSPSVNIGQINGATATTSSGFSSALGVGGFLRSGWQFGGLNNLYGTYTQTISTGGSNNNANTFISPLAIGGLDGTNASRALLTDTIGAPAVTSAPSNQAQQSIQELLLQILATLRASAHYQYETALGDRPRSVGDEPDNLIGDYLNQANQFTNIIN